MCALFRRFAGDFCTRAFRCNKFKTLLTGHVNQGNRHFTVASFQLSNRKYTDKHEWISLDGKIGTVGVSDYAQDALGDVVYVHAPEVGSTIERDNEVGVIESVKAVNEIYSPVSGTITEINEALVDKPSIVNESCYDKGWIYKLELSNLKEMDYLMDEVAYEKFLKTIHA